MKHYEFNFAIGPAQQFIGAARSTNDFWAGSFVLSWLSGVAMVTARKLGAQLVSPIGIDDVLNAIETGQVDALDRQAAAIPSKFCALVAKNPTEVAMDANMLAKMVDASVQTAWQALSALVYNKDIAGRRAYPDRADMQRKVLWDQQIKEVLDIQWTLSEPGQFMRRKHWRIQSRMPQQGGKCMLMPQFQELSLMPTNDKAKAFWTELVAHTGEDLGIDERLCAPALIKRRMRRLFEYLPTTLIAAGASGPWVLRGMKLNHRAPDTRTLAGLSGFYAIVRVDIDGLGTADVRSYAAVSAFAREASEIVAKATDNKGYTIYSGGDDVLAFVPAAYALSCAAALRWRLHTIQSLETNALTASAAVLLCHYKSSMADALHRSQALLSDVAKEATGRDALAVQLCKPGSDVQTYSAPWEKAWGADKPWPSAQPELKLHQFANLMGSRDGFSSGYLYWLRSFFNQVNMARNLDAKNDLWTNNMAKLMVVQYLHQQRSGDGAATTYAKAEEQLVPLIDLSIQYVRKQMANDEYKISADSKFTAQAALIGRFLASLQTGGAA